MDRWVEEAPGPCSFLWKAQQGVEGEGPGLSPPTLSCPPAWDLPDPNYWLLELALRGAG